MPFSYDPQWQGPLSGRSFEKQTEDFLNGIERRVDEIDSRQTPSDATPMAPGAGDAGTSLEYSRGDHRHPLQTNVSGNAGTATALQTPRNISIIDHDGTHSGQPSSFDGSAGIDIRLPATISADLDGTASDAAKLETARQIAFSNEGSGSASFDGSADIDIPLAVSCTAVGSTERRGIAVRFADIINVKDFGAKGDGITDDADAITAAYQFAVSKGGGNLFFPHGSYLVGRPLDFYRSSKALDHPGESIFWYATHYVPISLSGETETASKIVAGFSDPSRAVIESIPSAAVLAQSDGRSAPLNIYNLGFVYPNNSDENTAPGFVWVYGHGNSYLENVNFLGGRNVHLKSLGAQNVRLDNVTSWYGGHAWSYKNTPGTSGTVGRTLINNVSHALITASAAVFSAEDAGKKITVGGRDGILQYTIASVTSSTVAVAEERGLDPEVYSYSFDWLLFESARATVAANGTTLTANCSCFSLSDVGREIYIQNGMRDVAGDQTVVGTGIFRTKITGFTSATTVSISPAPSIAVEDEFFAQGAVEFFSNEGVTSEDSSDVKATMLHIEHYAGVGLVAKNCNSYGIINSKIHGETFTARYGDWQHSSTPSLFYAAIPVRNLQSCCGAWLDNFAGDVNCDFDTVCASNGPLVRISRQKGAVAFRDTHARILPNQLFISEQQYSGKGVISVDGFYSWSSHRTPKDLLDGPDNLFNGVLVAAYGEEIYIPGQENPFVSVGDARVYLGKDISVERDGLYPSSSSDMFLGSASSKWRSIYGKTIYADSNILPMEDSVLNIGGPTLRIDDVYCVKGHFDVLYSPAATSSAAGLMSAADKTKLDSVGTVFTFKGSVADSTALPASGSAVGDAYAVEDTGTVSVWDGTAWVDLGQWDGMVPATDAQIDALFAA